MSLFGKKKSTEELIAETKAFRAELENLKVKNDASDAHRQVKDELRAEKQKAFDNSVIGQIWSGFKKEVRKKSEANKAKYDSSKKSDVKKKDPLTYTSPLLRENK